jgi:CheY-like chemotaxis protein
MKVLLVDDSPVNQMYTATLLEQINVQCQTAETGLHALELLLNDKELEFGLVLMDSQMPVMDGIRATKLIRRGYGGKGHKTIPVFALSGGGREEHRQECLDAGMNGYLEKPVTADQLQRILASF